MLALTARGANPLSACSFFGARIWALWDLVIRIIAVCNDVVFA